MVRVLDLTNGIHKDGDREEENALAWLEQQKAGSTENAPSTFPELSPLTLRDGKEHSHLCVPQVLNDSCVPRPVLALESPAVSAANQVPALQDLTFH